MIRGKIMEKIAMRQLISQKLEGPILPNVLNELKEKSRNLNYTIKGSGGLKAEVSGLTGDNFHWRHAVDLEGKTCSCSQWQISGKPCTHAIAFIGSLGKVKLDDYVHGYYSVECFKATYQFLVNPMVDKSQWFAADPGFEMWPPKLERAAGRPRVKRIKSRGEPRKRGPYQCKRCFRFGHIAKGYREPPTELGDELPPLVPPKSDSRKRKGNATNSNNTTKKSKAASTNSTELAVQLNPLVPTNSKSSKRKAKDMTKPSDVPKKSKKASMSTSTFLATLSPVSPGPTTRRMAAAASTPVSPRPTTRRKAATTSTPLSPGLTTRSKADISLGGIARRLIIN